MVGIILLIVAVLLLIIGLAGSFLPGLLGWPLSWIALLLIHFTRWGNSVTPKILGITLVIGLLIQLMDYLAPLWFTKKFGGSKYGIWGSIIGLIVGIIAPIPYGFIIGPFLGAVIGEYIGGKQTKEALKSGFGNFLGFIFSTGTKIAYGIAAIYLCVSAIISQA